MSQIQTRMTRQRAVILEELRKSRSHPTADELYSIVRERLPRISLGTVYRNLDFLADSGEIRRLESAGTIKRFDGNMHHHQHVRCVSCGCIGDVMPPLPTPDFDEMTVEGFSAIHNARVEFDGLCDACASRQAGLQ
ncbi:MAG: transcriptional repressor [Desulfovibrio sp.]|nr:transcriptional repressor [Desulfovibrio sp.]